MLNPIRNLRNISLIASTLAMALGTGALAQSTRGYSVGGALTTLGAAVEGSYHLNDRLAMRGMGWVQVSVDPENVGLSYTFTPDGETETAAIAMLLDYYPTASGLRLSGGLFVAGSALDGGIFSDGDAGFVGEVNMENSVAPVLAAGYRHDFADRWYISGEVGGIFSNFTVSSESQSELVQDAVDQVNAELEDQIAYPFVSLGLGMQF